MSLLLLALIGLSLLAVIAAVVWYFWWAPRCKKKSEKRDRFQLPTEGIKKVILDNGMTLLMYKTDMQPKVLVQIAYDIGSYIEQEGERGLAHLLEHMIFKGTAKLAEGDIDEIARKYGASFNAYTSMDVTSYYFEVDRNNWQPFVTILADCMQNARFDEQHLASELKAVIQELRMYKDNYWQVMFKKAFEHLFPANHPYHYPVIGYKEDLMNISGHRLKTFYDKYYQPNRATLFVIGDIDCEEATNLVREQFQAISNAHEPITRQFPHLPPALSRAAITCYEDVQNEQLAFFWRIPGMRGGLEHVAAATAFLLGDGEGSRIYRALVDKHKIATSVGVYDYAFMELGAFFILIEPLPGKIAQCREVVVEELQHAIAKGFSADELTHMVKTKAKVALQGMQKYADFAYEWINSFFAHGDEYAFFRAIDQFPLLKSHEVQDFIKHYLDPLTMNQIDLLPMPEALATVSQQAKAYEDELDQKILSKYVRTAPLETPIYVQTMPEPRPLVYSFPQPQRELTLRNGLTILLRRQAALPIVSVECKFKEAFYLGHAHMSVSTGLMMDSLIEGSQGQSKEDNVGFFEFHGADYNFSSAGASLSILNADLEPLLQRFLHVLTKPTFASANVQKVRTNHIDSYKRAMDDNKGMAMNILQSVVYANHPFGGTYAQALEELAKLDANALKTRHQQLVSPNNMILSIVGDLELGDIQRLVERTFGSWAAGSEFVPTYTERSFEFSKHVDYPMLRDQTVLALGQPSKVNFYDPDYLPLKLLNYISFYSLGSRLYKLRERTGLFYTAFGGWAADVSSEKGFDYLGAIVNPDKVAFAEEEMRGMVRELAEQGVTGEELAAAKQMYLKSILDLSSTNRSVANALATLKSWQLGFDHYDKALKRVQAIDVAEMNAICAKYCSTEGMARVRVGRF